MVTKRGEHLVALLLGGLLQVCLVLSRQHPRVEGDGGGFDSPDHLLAGVLAQLANLHAFQDGAWRIGILPETAGTLQHRAKTLSRFNPIDAGMPDLAAYRSEERR